MAKTKPEYQKASFILSAAKLSQLPADEGIEVAFVGRSNAGKSSVLNELTQNRKLARVSKTPGRTQHINLFDLQNNKRLVDLPGYGFAKVSPEIKMQWQKTLDAYLQERHCLRGLVLVMDIRHPLTDFDRHLLLWADACELTVHVLLNKADKLSFGQTKKTLFEVEKSLQKLNNPISVQPFSALKGTGLKELKEILDGWFAG